ncbi:hypothetical protein N7478_001532 [Penicillium angulare]|uniref:uncharacterized protein n=1 Tax=Penicillium angulare TaxID=116970 RepID=UPI0025413B78|nr:uncharacterized protein N7478_001532 [Penicillium angulare]KAJ5288502.1 hypothetical protein N7478_001532 [Penicillium angulare]
MLSLSRGQHVLRFSLKSQKHHLILNPSIQLFSTSAALKSNRPPSQSPTNTKKDHGQSKTTTPTVTGTATKVDTPGPHEINAPTSTFPADLARPPPLPPSTPTLSKLTHYLAIGKAFLAFYKTGLKNSFYNYRAALPLRKELGLPSYIPSSPSTIADKHIGRGQFQLVRRSARDVRRLIPFFMVLIVCGEFTPLLIPIFGSTITPATCRIPSQVHDERNAASKRKTLALQALGTSVQGNELETLLRISHPDWVRAADSKGVLSACAVLGLVKRHDRFAGALLTGPVYRPRLNRYLEYLAVDDALIRNGGGVKELSPNEVMFALDERGASDVAVGYPSESKADVARREWLMRWLELRGKQEKSLKTKTV